MIIIIRINTIINIIIIMNIFYIYIYIAAIIENFNLYLFILL